MTLLKGWGSYAIGLLVFGALALGPLISSPVWAQVSGATLSGIISDSSGSVVPGAKVSIANTATGIVRDVTATDAGFYTAQNLQPGPYRVTVSATGFTTLVESGIELTVGAQPVLNLTLKVGQVSQQVEVTGEAPSVELTSATLSNQVEGPAIRELPLNGRDWTSLATLQPGVTSLAGTQYGYTQNGQNRTARGYGLQLSIAGALPFDNVYRVDGIVINDYANGVPGNALGGSLGVDAIDEFTVLTRNYSAAYGRSSGGVVNAITRSGTNLFHGTVYEFLRNSALDARNFFDPPIKPPLRRNQFGASAGLPIRKDKTFVFVDYEGLRQFFGVTNNAVVPSAAVEGGTSCSIPTGVTPNCTPTPVAVSSLVKPYFPLWGPVNNGYIGNGDTGYYRFEADQVIGANYGLVRFDHHFSDKDSFFASFVDDTSNFTQPDNLQDVQVLQQTANKRIVVAENHIFGGLVNSIRFGYNRVNAFGGGGTVAYNPAAADPSLGAGMPPFPVPPIPGNPPVDAPAISPGSGITGFLGGLVHQPYNTFVWNSYQWYDDLIKTVGKHNLTFGGGVEHDQDAKVTYVSGAGSFSYANLNAFLTNANPNTFSATVLPPSPLRHYHVTLVGAYINDDYRMRKNLTVNLGVRYEMLTVPTETKNLWANLPSLSATSPTLGGPPFSNPTLRNFAPRIGLAWDPFGDGKTSIRSGFGMFDVEILPYEFSALNAQTYPYYLRLSNSAVVSTPSAPAFPIGALVQTQAAGSYTGYYMEQHPKRNYVMQWNLSVQRELSPSMTLLVAYVGSRGVHGEDLNYDANMVLPTLTSAGYLWPTPISSGTKTNPNPSYGQIFYQSWDDASSYNGLVTQVTRRLSHGFQIQGSNTWAKSFDVCSCGVSSSSFLNSLQNQYFFIKNNRALSDYNIKDVLVINGMWTSPTPHFNSRVANFALGGWQTGGIFTIRNGIPFTVDISGDPLGTRATTIPPDFLTYLHGNPGCAAPVNPGNVKQYVNLSCFTLPMQNGTTLTPANCVAFKTVAGTCANLLGNGGRNILTGPGSINLDYSVYKNIKMTERLQTQFRAEFFNILNRANFNSPGLAAGGALALYGSTGAAITGASTILNTSTNSRQIQFALKLIW